MFDDFPYGNEPKKINIPWAGIQFYLNLKLQGLPGSAVPAGSLSSSQPATDLWLLRFSSKINSRNVAGNGKKKKRKCKKDRKIQPILKVD